MADRELELTKTQLLDALADYLEVRGIGGCQGKFLKYIEQIRQGVFETEKPTADSMMVCGVWLDDSSSLVTGFDLYLKQPKISDDDKLSAILVGETWDDIMRRYHEFMGWEPYVPMEED